METYQDGIAALGDPTRRAVFELLAEGPTPVGRLAERLPISRPAVSQHLAVLKAAGLVTDRPEGTRRLYEIDPAGVAAMRRYLDRFWDRTLHDFKTALEKETPMTIAPVRKQITVQASQEKAFDFFTARMGDWWNPQHQIGDRPFVDVVVEPREGGRWFERDSEDVECQWGKVLVWEPPGRVVLAWQLDATWSYDADFVTELELRFVVEAPAVTRVELEHRGMDAYGDAAPDMMAQMDSGGGWGGLLARYCEALASVGGRA